MTMEMRDGIVVYAEKDKIDYGQTNIPDLEKKMAKHHKKGWQVFTPRPKTAESTRDSRETKNSNLLRFTGREIKLNSNEQLRLEMERSKRAGDKYKSKNTIESFRNLGVEIEVILESL